MRSEIKQEGDEEVMPPAEVFETPTEILIRHHLRFKKVVAVYKRQNRRVAADITRRMRVYLADGVRSFHGMHKIPFKKQAVSDVTLWKILARKIATRFGTIESLCEKYEIDPVELLCKGTIEFGQQRFPRLKAKGVLGLSARFAIEIFQAEKKLTDTQLANFLGYPTGVRVSKILKSPTTLQLDTFEFLFGGEDPMRYLIEGRKKVQELVMKAAQGRIQQNGGTPEIETKGN